MAGYLIADVDVTNPGLFAEYRELTLPTVEKYGGRYLIRGGDSEVLEGDSVPHRTVVIEFDSVERAKEWNHSEEYADAKKMRIEATNTNLIVVEGV